MFSCLPVEEQNLLSVPKVNNTFGVVPAHCKGTAPISCFLFHWVERQILEQNGIKVLIITKSQKILLDFCCGVQKIEQILIRNTSSTFVLRNIPNFTVPVKQGAHEQKIHKWKQEFVDSVVYRRQKNKSAILSFLSWSVEFPFKRKMWLSLMVIKKMWKSWRKRWRKEDLKVN